MSSIAYIYDQYWAKEWRPTTKYLKFPEAVFKGYNFLLLIGLLFLLSVNVNAQEGPRQAINVCAVAIPLMNMYVVNYEYLYHEHHGLAARIEYAPKLTGADTKGVAWACVINYRWHFSPKLENFFVGPYGRYCYVYGSGTAQAKDYEFKVPEVNLGINGGYRWISKIGINIVLAAGYGFSMSKDKLTPSDVISTFHEFKKANDTNSVLLDAPFYGEFSIGYAF